MVLVHVFFNAVVVTPPVIVAVFNAIAGTPSNPDSAKQLTSIQNMTSIFSYFYYVVCISLH